MTREQDTAKKIVQILEHGTSELDAATTGKLAAARARAVSGMAEAARSAHAAPAYSGTGHSVIEYLRGHHHWTPALLALLAAALIFTLLQQNSPKEPVETDVLLLASDLPPAAYVDQGFDAWLKKSSRH